MYKYVFFFTESKHYRSIDSDGFLPIAPSFHPFFRSSNLNPYFSTPPLYYRSNPSIYSSTTQSPYFEDELTILKGGILNLDDYREPFEAAAAAATVRYNYRSDQFSNFKDFADIVDLDSDNSYVVKVYAHKNSTKFEPNNILDTLQMLDQQKHENKTFEKSKLMNGGAKKKIEII